jgi:FixJ family two-component response regulator
MPMLPDGARVYVLDDDASFVRSTLRLLEAWGVAAEGFTSPSTFLEREPGDAPACALVDVRMPRMSGLEVQRALAATLRKLPVVFVSGHVDVKTGVEAMKAGAVDFLPKPVDEHRLLDAIRRALALDVSARAGRLRARDARRNLERLTSEERRVCRIVGTGLRDDQIADALGWTEEAVRSARLRAMEVLSVRSLIELLRVVEAADEAADAQEAQEAQEAVAADAVEAA